MRFWAVIRCVPKLRMKKHSSVFPMHYITNSQMFPSTSEEKHDESVCGCCGRPSAGLVPSFYFTLIKLQFSCAPITLPSLVNLNALISTKCRYCGGILRAMHTANVTLPVLNWCGRGHELSLKYSFIFSLFISKPIGVFSCTCWNPPPLPPTPPPSV